jgi:hypothetical protein
MTQTTTNGNGHSGDAPEATLISVILDRSGSMASVREPTIQGFNEFLQAQRQQNDGGRALLSLTQFDDRYEVNFVGEPIENVPDLDTNSYVPRSRTALYDAIGRTVHEVEAWTREHDWKERVLVLIITDGQENASREYTFEAARARIEQKEKDGWNFAYMGANQDSYAVGGSLNIRQDFSANYDSTPVGTAANYQRMASATSKYRASKMKGAASPSFFDTPVEPNEANPSTGKLTPKGASAATTGDRPPSHQGSTGKRPRGSLSAAGDKEPGH